MRHPTKHLHKRAVLSPRKPQTLAIQCKCALLRLAMDYGVVHFAYISDGLSGRWLGGLSYRYPIISHPIQTKASNKTPAKSISQGVNVFVIVLLFRFMG
jgi:hypothetical protein